MGGFPTSLIFLITVRNCFLPSPSCLVPLLAYIVLYSLLLDVWFLRAKYKERVRDRRFLTPFQRDLWYGLVTGLILIKESHDNIQRRDEPCSFQMWNVGVADLSRTVRKHAVKAPIQSVNLSAASYNQPRARKSSTSQNALYTKVKGHLGNKMSWHLAPSPGRTQRE